MVKPVSPSFSFSLVQRCLEALQLLNSEPFIIQICRGLSDCDPCARSGSDKMLHCYRAMISATLAPGALGLMMVQYENRSNGSLWIIVYLWIGGNGIIDFFDGRDYLEQSRRTQNKGCFIPMILCLVTDCISTSIPWPRSLKAPKMLCPSQIEQTVINHYLVWSAGFTILNRIAS